MSLFTKDETFDIAISYTRGDKGELKFDTEGEIETFTFRRPNWQDTRALMSASVIVSAQTGQAIVDPYRMMDMKIKTLLKDWTIKKDGEKVEVTPENIDKLEPDLVQYLYNKLNSTLSITEEVKPTEPSK